MDDGRQLGARHPIWNRITSLGTGSAQPDGCKSIARCIHKYTKETKPDTTKANTGANWQKANLNLKKHLNLNRR